MLRYVYGGDIPAAKWKDYGKDLLEAPDKYGLSNLKTEAEAWYVKLLKFSAGNVVEAVVYAEKMNCYLLKEAAIDFIVANAKAVLASGTLMNIPESNVTTRNILCSVATMNKQGQYNNEGNDLDKLLINGLQTRLASSGNDFDGPKETLIARLVRNRKRKAVQLTLRVCGCV